MHGVSQVQYSKIYHGRAEKLGKHIAAVLAGKEVTVTVSTRPFSLFQDRMSPFNEALRLRQYPVMRVKASLKIGANLAGDYKADLVMGKGGRSGRNPWPRGEPQGPGVIIHGSEASGV
jgi:hypothetical protein